MRRVRHFLSHLLHGATAGLRAAGQLEMQVVRHLPYLRIERAGRQRQLDSSGQRIAVRTLRFHASVPVVYVVVQ